MTGLAVTVLLGLASTLLIMRSSGRSGTGSSCLSTQDRSRPGGRSGRDDLSRNNLSRNNLSRDDFSRDDRASHDSAPLGRGLSRLRLRRMGRIEVHELPLFIHQLAGLLRAGRPPHALWADMQRLHAVGTSTFSAAVVPVLGAAGRAAALGLSVPNAMRQATATDPVRGPENHEEVQRMWVDLAGCLEVAERSGAPLASILEQYAGQLDAHLDGLAARETALAGPRATVILLAWLPVVGLGLGFALGINPVELLTGSLLGRLALAAGVLLTIVGRFWSKTLIRNAGGRTS